MLSVSRNRTCARRLFCRASAAGIRLMAESAGRRGEGRPRSSFRLA